MRQLFTAILFLCAPTALAQEYQNYEPPSAEELREALFGVHLFGVVDGGETWNECIEKDGDTLYTIGDVQSRGKAWVPEAGWICFNYGDDRDNCFTTIRTENGWVFRGYGTTWETTQIRDDVEVCLLSDMIG